MPLDLIIVLITGFTIFFIGSVVYYHDRKSISNLLFFLISLITLLWSIVNYFSLNIDVQHVLFWIRFVLFFATPHSVLFFLFIYNFPGREISMPRKWFVSIIFLMLFTMGATLSPYVFSEVIVDGGITPLPGFLMPLFIAVVVGSLLSSVYLAIKKYLRAKDREKRQWRSVLLGILISYALLIFTNFVLVIIAGNTSFNVYGPLFMLPAIIGTAYAILRHRLMNVRVIGTEVLIFIILSVGLVEIFTSSGVVEVTLRVSGFVVLFIFSILLIRSVLNEVKQREQLEKITKRLQEANNKLTQLDEAKTEFLSITSHQLRTPLSAIKGYLSMLNDGDYGKMSGKQAEVIDTLVRSTERLIRLVNIFLNISRIESGRLKIIMGVHNLNQVLDDVVKSLFIEAQKKGIELKFAPIDLPQFSFDDDKLHDVVVNLVDNAIKYTPQGGVVEVMTKLLDKYVVVMVKDNGHGIEYSELDSLFEKFKRGKDIYKVDPSGSGLGLFIARKIVEGHGGNIWAESDGIGKGASFKFTLPL